MSLATRYTQILWDGQDENGGKNGEATRWAFITARQMMPALFRGSERQRVSGLLF